MIGVDYIGETTFAVLIENVDGLEPVSNTAIDGVSLLLLLNASFLFLTNLRVYIAESSQNPIPWIPALRTDTLQSSSQDLPGGSRGDGDECTARHEPLLHVKALETGIIDVSHITEK